MTGFPKAMNENQTLQAISTPARPAVSVQAAPKAESKLGSPFRYSRRYLDWNRLTFEYHAGGSQSTIDTWEAETVSNTIHNARNQLTLFHVYGCAPRSYCTSCVEYGDPGNLLTLYEDILATVVVNPSRANKSRMIMVNKGRFRADLPQGGVTDTGRLMINPYNDQFQYIPDVPFDQAIVRHSEIANQYADQYRQCS
jgi:hypothetical protein